jgi:glycosyltransferase involved in cell wall biosynthesis
MSRLTIIMPVYNASVFIKEAVDSILNQTYQDFELWIVDDASTDDSRSIIKLFKDSRIKIFLNATNQGRVRTVNNLVKEISSPYFTITDADDVSHPQKLQIQIDFLESHPDYVMVGTSYWAMDEKGFFVREMKLKTKVNELRLAALSQSQFLGPTTVMRKSVLDHFPEFYRHYFIDNFADADLSSMILDKFNATNINESLYFYRVLKNSVTRKKVTVRNLNLHRLIGFLSRQRREQGKDCLQRGKAQEADEFLETVQKEYDADPSIFLRHQAFFHLYWGLTDLAISNGWKAFLVRPFYLKNLLSFILIVFRIGGFSLNRTINRKHYLKFIS